jgi:hypothetical protein
MDGWIRGASAEYDAACAYGERLDEATEAYLTEWLADDGSVEAGIGEKADMILWAVNRLREHGNAEAFLAAFDQTIRSYLEIAARRQAERDVYVRGRAA